MIRRRNLFCYAMVAIPTALVLLLGVYPMLDSLRLSVLEYDLLTIHKVGTPFVGLANFRTVLSEPRFVQAFTNTLIFAVIITAGALSLGLVVAQALNLEFPGRGTFRTAVLVPWVTPPVVASVIWMWMFQTERSPINQVLRASGLLKQNIQFLNDTQHLLGPLSIPMAAVSVVRIWHGLPFAAVLILAALQSIPRDLYEAADVDGASPLTKFRYITIPQLLPVLSILTTLLLISALGAFEVNYIMTGGGPNNLTSVLAVVSYQQAFVFYRFDLAAAMSSLILVLTSVIAAIYIRERMRNA